MASFRIWCVISLLTLQDFLANGHSVPGLYVFGDSSVDAGNNNYLNTNAKANMFPYGIDFNNHSTGRFSNGKTFADIIAIKLGLPMSPPYLGISKIERYQVTTGINYASASCGILNSTRNGDCLSMNQQIEYFTSTVINDLPRILPSNTKLRHYLFKSIYLISIGSNDYILNYLKNTMGNKNIDNPEDYANFLLNQLASHIKRIYDLGARKFVVVGVGPVGCIPSFIIRTPQSQDCNEDINQKVKPFSDNLPGMLQELQAQLLGSLFVNVDTYNFFMKLRNSPEKFGSINMVDSCFVPGAKPCENRKQFYFFDFAHTTEVVNHLYANECFGGTQLCFPLTIKQLVHAH
ncbi:hypothetical protein RJT34_17952 [Clitoria ternatea]|uniref:Triacylglycerol lipase n=1 Tax=Clitoria ternatea TaxID=43366 RepID=A0AAN9JB49_CLITE